MIEDSNKLTETYESTSWIKEAKQINLKTNCCNGTGGW